MGQTNDSLRALIASQNPSEQLPALMDLSWSLRNQHSDSALQLIDRAEMLANQLLDTSAMVTAAIRKGVLLKNDGQWEKAQVLFENAVALATLQQDSIALARALINAGQNHKAHGDYEKALPELLHAIGLLKNSNQSAYLTVSYTTLAGIYIQLNQPKEAIPIYDRLLVQSRANSDSATTCQLLYNLGVAYFAMSAYKEALDHLNSAVILAKIIHDPMHEAQSYNAIGSVYFEQQDNSKALSFFQKALPLCISWDMHIEQASVLNNLAATYEALGKTQEAIEHYRKAAILARQMDNRANLFQMYFNLSEIHEHAQEADSALYYYQLYSILKDSVFNKESNRQIVEMQTKYNTAIKDEAIAQLKVKEGEQNAALEKRQTWLIAALLLAIVFAIALGVYLSKLKVQRALTRKNQELYKQNTIQLMNENVAQSMKAHLDGETAERLRLAGELHDKLGSQLAAIKLHYDQLEPVHDDDAQNDLLLKANALLEQSCIDVRKIAHNLASDTLHEFGLEAATADLASSISSSELLEVHLHCIAMNQRFSTTVELILFRAIQELIANAIKHASATQIRILMKGWDNELLIEIQDNGKGFEHPPTAEHFGFGLSKIHERMTELGGQLTLTSSKEKGTTVLLCMPFHEKQKTSTL